MKIFSRTLIKISVFLSLFLLFGQTSFSQENKCVETNYLIYDDVIDRFWKRRSGLSSEQINAELIPEIRKNKAGFDLTSEREKQLRDSGGNDLLINAIRENLLPEDAIEAIKLYRIYEYHYRFEDEVRVKIAIDAANNFIAKFGNDECYKEQTEYFRTAVPVLQKIPNKEDISVPVDPKVKYKFELLRKVEKAYRSANWNEAFVLGERVLEVDPEYIDLVLVLASVGFKQTRTEAYKGKFDNETIRYAELAIKLLESGKELNTEDFGALDYRFKTYRFPDGKANALGWMNCYIGYIKYYHQNQKAEGLSYYHRATQYLSEARQISEIYRLFGEFYCDRLSALDQKRMQLLEKDGKADTSKIDREKKTLLDRAIDAYARTIDAFKKRPEKDEKNLKDSYDKLQELLKLRDKNKASVDLEKLISATIQKPMPDLLK